MANITNCDVTIDVENLIGMFYLVLATSYSWTSLAIAFWLWDTLIQTFNMQKIPFCVRRSQATVQIIINDSTLLQIHVWYNTDSIINTNEIQIKYVSIDNNFQEYDNRIVYWMAAWQCFSP